MLASCCVARKIFLSDARASSRARTLDSRPTTNGVIIWGKMTTSRMGIMGRFLLTTVVRRRLVQFLESPDPRHPAYKFRNQAKLDQVLRLHISHQLRLALLGGGRNHLGLFLAGLESKGLSAGTAADNLVQPYKGATTDKQDVGGIYRGEFLVRMLAPALGRNIGDGSFQNLQKGLLHAFTRYVTGDRRVFILAAALVNFI